MGIETSVGNRKGKQLSELKSTNPPPNRNPNSNPPAVTTTHSRGKKGRRRGQKKPVMEVSRIQKLFNTCKEVFAFGGVGVVPSTDKIDKLRAVLDDITPEDVGLNPDMLYFRGSDTGGSPAIRYLHLYESDDFSMGIFCLPPSGVLPLHNHPGMTVFSKLLFGTMHIKSYDWAADGQPNTSRVVDPLEVKQPVVQQEKVPEKNQPEEKQPEVRPIEVKQPEVQQAKVKEQNVQKTEVKQPDVLKPKIHLAKVKVDSDFTAPCNTSILYPADGGNMHCFTALTACAVLDVLGPPYCDPEGRHCQYYYDFPYADFSVDGVSVPEEEKNGYAWLQEREFPDDLTVVGGTYTGPKIIHKGVVYP